MAGVYISYPFCAQKCTYCNFASGVLPRDLEPKYVGALRSEIGVHEWRWQPETVYLGGGTPSRMAMRDLEEVLAVIPDRPWKEATLEAAPGGIDDGRVVLVAPVVEADHDPRALSVHPWLLPPMRASARCPSRAIKSLSTPSPSLIWCRWESRPQPPSA